MNCPVGCGRPLAGAPVGCALLFADVAGAAAVEMDCGTLSRVSAVAAGGAAPPVDPPPHAVANPSAAPLAANRVRNPRRLRSSPEVLCDILALPCFAHRSGPSLSVLCGEA